MNAEDPSHLVQRLLASGLSTRELAALAGCSQSYISRLNCGNRGRRTQPTLVRKLQRLANRIAA